MKKKMKNKYIIAIIVCILIVTLGTVFYIQRGKKTTSIILGGIHLPSSAKYLEEKDTHGGFHGDGEYYAKIQLSQIDAEKFIKEGIDKGTWSNMPLDKDLPIHDNIFNYEQSILSNIDGTFKSSQILNGIYFFKDRFAEQSPESYEQLIKEDNYCSGNYTLSILDSTNNILYIYKLDS